MVAVVEPADVRPRDDFARLGPLHASTHRSIFAQREMRAPVMVVGDIRSQHPLQGSLIEHDDVIEAHSRRIDPITRSTYGSCHGLRGAVWTSSIPIA